MLQTEFVEKIKKTRFFLYLENLPAYEIMWNNTVELDRSQVIIRCMQIACWTNKSRNTPSEFVIYIAVPLQQWLHERVSLLHL